MTRTGKSILAMLATALIASLTVVASTTTVSSDSGDGREACNFGEICFQDWTWSTRYRKHFWWSAAHDYYWWWDAVANRYTQRVKNDANTVRNRDSVCWVGAIADHNDGIDDFFNVPNNGWIHILPFDVRNRNDRHERCYVPGGPGGP